MTTTLDRAGEAVAAALSPRRIRSTLDRVERRLGLTPMGLVGLALTALLWGIARLVAGKTLYLFAYGTLLLVIVTWAGARRRLPLEGTRAQARARAREGEVLRIEVRLRARRRLSTIVLEEQVPERLGQPVRLPVATLARGEEVAHVYPLRCARRGVYQLGPLVARWGDPIGLTQREMVLAPSFELLVHPSTESVSDRPLTRQWEDPPIRPPVSKPWPSGLEFYGMRDYVPGDDLRRIVWRAVARTGRVLVREAEQGITDRITIILDTDRSSHTHEDPSESFEAAIRVAASLGIKHLGEGYAVSVDTNDGPLTKALRGPGSPTQLLDSLTRLGFGREPLSRVILRLATDPRRDAHNILITPRLEASVAAQLRLLLNRGVSVLVVALLWDEGAEETLNTAAALGCQVVELRPNESIAAALTFEVGAGRR
jgi:uncharacterized protein (DUF58 family)